MRAPQGKGYTLIELLMVAGLMSVTAGLLLFNAKGSGKGAGSQALAQVLAEELRQTRNLAVATQTPVAVVFPGTGAGAGLPQSTSFYQLEGWSAPRITRVKQFKGDFPGLCFFQGSWNVDPSKLRSPAGINAANPTILGDKWSSWKVEQWLPASSRQDYCFIFTPDGRARTNDLPSFDRAYHILVCDGVAQYGSAAPPANCQLSQQPAYFRPTSLGKTCTVTLDVNGAVSVSEGLVAAVPGTVQQVGSASGLVQLAGGRQQPPRTAPLPSVPQIKISSLSPNPAAGTDVSVAPDGYITLEATVADTANSGERLYCVWQVTPEGGNLGVGPSDYSIPVTAGRGVAMDWDNQANAWHSTWEWRPPADGKGGDKFKLRLLIQDSSGTDLTAAIEKKVSVCPPGEIYYGGGLTFAFFSMLQRMNADGSGKKTLFMNPFSAAFPCPKGEAVGGASADGSRVAVGTSRDTPVGDYGFQVYLTNRDGSSAYRVSGPIGQACEAPCLSPFGNLVAYKQIDPSNNHILVKVTNADPDPARRATLTVDDLGVDGGWFMGASSRQAFMGDDRLSWDMRVDDANQLGVLYYSKWDTPAGLNPHLYSAKVTVDALGRPAGRTLQGQFTPVPDGAFAPFSFSAITSSGVRQDYLFFTKTDAAHLKSGFLRFGSPTNTLGVAEAGAASGDLRPVPFMDGDQLRLLVQEKIPATGFARVVRLTPPFSDTVASDRTDIASPDVGGLNSFGPCFTPAKP